MLGIVDVGGGIRGVYSSGIYDAFLDEGFAADYGIGVSAGAANLITYIAGQRGRTFTFYNEYFQRKECVSLDSFIKTGSYLSLDYLFTTLSNEGGENPLNLEKALESPTLFRLVTTRAEDGKACYIDKNQFVLNDYVYLKATCCLPIVCRPVNIDGKDYYDGGIADPIPFRKAFEDGCDRVIIILTKPREDYTLALDYLPLLKKFSRKYPEVLKLAESMHKRNEESLREIAQLEKEGKAVVLEPGSCFGMKTLSKDTDAIKKMYWQGYEDGIKCLKDFLRAEK